VPVISIRQPGNNIPNFDGLSDLPVHLVNPTLDESNPLHLMSMDRLNPDLKYVKEV
jgi:hypothetical protein